MAETFRCPSCSAPLEFEGKMMQKCRHCGSNIIVPPDVMRYSNSFGGAGSIDFGDASNANEKSLKVAEIRRELQRGNKIMAIKIYRETFDSGLKEAKDAVEAMEGGENSEFRGTHFKMTVQTTNLTSDSERNDENASILVPLLAVVFMVILIIGLLFIFRI